MIGAIIGDVVGSRFEFRNIKNKDFRLFTNSSTFTDDTVMTIAVMDFLLHAETRDERNVIKYLQKWGRKYLHAGYGSKFIEWLKQKNPKPYNSCGNGSAMKISGIGWASDNLYESMELADLVTRVSHNHIEGLKGAKVVTQMILMARLGCSKDEMLMFASQCYNLNLDYEELKRTYSHEKEICQCTLPQALFCFFISNSFEDCLRTTISIGGDCDTTAAISCAIAEAYYGVPEEIVEETKKRLPKEMLDVIEEFKEKYGGQ
ncbi:MAG: ADP-ribosylglycohydrolase family protein [Bacilli bacterium]|nr:ADP-ribosylglycohydrolase family protein [Bacilli bacterium]